MSSGLFQKRHPALGHALAWQVAEQDDRIRVAVDGEEMELEVRPRDGVGGYCRWKGRWWPYALAWAGEDLHLWLGGRLFVFRRSERQRQGVADDAKDAEVTAPVPGKVLRIMVAPGDEVQRDQALLVIESMKMEHLLRAVATGRVGRVLVKEGSSVAAGARLLEMEPSTTETSSA